MPRRAWFIAIWIVAVAVFGAGWPRAVAAHPADRLKQQIIVGLAASELRLTLAIGGGILANELVIDDLDPDRDGVVTDAERLAWIEAVLRDLRVTLNGTDVAIDPAQVETTIPPVEDFHIGVSPLVVSVPMPIPDGAADGEQRLVVRDDYHLDRTDFQLEVQANPGATIVDQSWPGRTVRIAFTVDPAQTGLAAKPDATSAESWGKGGVIARAKAVLERPKSPGLIGLLIGVFVLMGALHAIQPGHGKTLVAAYLVATKGTPRDALTLAGIVTFTHTISVFALGLATLAASRFFLPSRVIPVMGVLSGLLVAGMGLSMLRRATRRQARREAIAPPLPAVEHGSASAVLPVATRKVGMQFAPHGPSLHDHAGLTEEEHTRLHLHEALAARRSGVDQRGLVALGVAGGMAPCPDALAILLLAIGMNQTGFGMVAIVAFSVGLAGVLVAFGLAIALAGPIWTRTRQAALDRGRTGYRLNIAFGRLVTVSPLVSAVVVLLLGLAMIWRASSSV
jgi:nickel/cobalt transporter (NicO) family protein